MDEKIPSRRKMTVVETVDLAKACAHDMRIYGYAIVCNVLKEHPMLFDDDRHIVEALAYKYAFRPTLH